jgi:hypothetical protein
VKNVFTLQRKYVYDWKGEKVEPVSVLVKKPANRKQYF